MKAQEMTQKDIRDILRNLFLNRVGVASTLANHLRNTARLRRWAEGKGYHMWTLSTYQLALFIRDESVGGPTVAGHEWAPREK